MEGRGSYSPGENIPGTESKYSLSRRAFLDVIWNRIEIVEFYRTTCHRGRVDPLPNCSDRFGRVKVALAINTDFPKNKQAQTLVHESIHVDLASWEKTLNFPSWSDEFYKAKVEEERLTEDAANEFYSQNKQLALKALNHLWLRREPRKMPREMFQQLGLKLF